MGKESKHQLADLAKQNSQMRADLVRENLEMRNKILKAKLANSTAHQEKLAAGIETLKGTGNALKERAEMIRSKNSELTASLKDATSAAGTITKKENDKLVAQVAALDASNRDLKMHAEKLRQHDAKKKMELKDAQKKKIEILREQKYEKLTNKLE